MTPLTADDTGVGNSVSPGSGSATYPRDGSLNSSGNEPGDSSGDSSGNSSGNSSGKVSQPDVIRRVLTTHATWAVVGLSAHPTRTAYGVARWLRDALGQQIIPVHPRAEDVWGETGYQNLSQIPDDATVAVVDCFVNSARVGAVVDEAIANKDRLGIQTLWLQLGVVDHEAAERALSAGLAVVMDTCPMIEYPKL